MPYVFQGKGENCYILGVSGNCHMPAKQSLIYASWVTHILGLFNSSGSCLAHQLASQMQLHDKTQSRCCSARRKTIEINTNAFKFFLIFRDEHKCLLIQDTLQLQRFSKRTDFFFFCGDMTDFELRSQIFQILRIN